MRLIVLFTIMLLSITPGWAQISAVTGATAETAADAPAAADDSVEQLIRILQDDRSRQLLIEKLQQATSQDVQPETSTDLSIVRQLAEYTRAAAQGTSKTFASLGSLVGTIQNALRGTNAAEMRAFMDVAVNVVLVGVALFGSFLILRLVVLWLDRHLSKRAEGRGWIRRIISAALAMLTDGVSVFVAWGLGYVAAIALVGSTPGQMGINQSLLLNAFLVVEVIKMVVRAILSPRFRPLRLLPVGDNNAAYWSFWLARIISLVGYTFLFVSPLIAANLDPVISSALQVLVMATAVTIGIVIVMQNKDDVRTWLTQVAARRNNDGYGQLLLLLGRHWHSLAIVYLVTLLIVWFANPEQALPFMLGATVQSVIAVVVGVVIISFIARFVSGDFQLPPDVTDRLPLLEARLHTFVPTVMQFVRWIVIVGVLVAIAQAWALFDFVGWIGSASGQQVAGSVISAVVIVLACVVLQVVVASWVEYRLNPNFGKPPTAREKTLLNLFKNAFNIALIVFGLMLALAQIGVNIAPLLAGAGVIGLAIGFGAQKLVQDIITGIFIQFENVMNEGDVVEAAGKSGVVEKLTIRSVTIRDMSGTVHLIPFSSVDQVSNMVRGYSFYVAEFEVSRDADIEHVKQTMRDAFGQVMDQSEHRDVILDELDLQGLIAITPQSMSLRARIKTLAGKQWGPGRLYSELVMRLFDERGIATPTTQVRYISDRRGSDAERLPMAGAPEAG